jgi:long-chain acyl-CoA synthetase
VQPAAGVEPGGEFEAELRSFTREHIAGYKVPKRFEFLDELPRLPTGKLYKRKLRDQYWQGRESRI